MDRRSGDRGWRGGGGFRRAWGGGGVFLFGLEAFWRLFRQKNWTQRHELSQGSYSEVCTPSFQARNTEIYFVLPILVLVLSDFLRLPSFLKGLESSERSEASISIKFRPNPTRGVLSYGHFSEHLNH